MGIGFLEIWHTDYTEFPSSERSERTRGTENLLIDSASIGGIVDIYRKSAEGTHSLKLVGYQG